jgi:hypothetical protein
VAADNNYCFDCFNLDNIAAGLVQRIAFNFGSVLVRSHNSNRTIAVIDTIASTDLICCPGLRSLGRTIPHLIVIALILLVKSFC